MKRILLLMLLVLSLCRLSAAEEGAPTFRIKKVHPKSYSWGKEFFALDPDGYQWSFIELPQSTKYRAQ